MKDIRLPMVNVLLVLWKWWTVVREKMEFCAQQHDYGYRSFTKKVSGKILNQILLEVLMNCTKHIDLSSSSTASCVARFFICWVCRLYFSGLACSVLSLAQAAQAPAVRWSSCAITVMAVIIRVCMGIFTSALRNKKIRLKKKHLTLLPQRIACYLPAYFDKKNAF